MFVGGGRNGKGKSIELIKRLIGMDNITSLPLSTLDPESFDISDLFGKMVNLAGDIGYQDLKDTSVYKSLTGRDLFGAKRKFLNKLKFVNYAKFIFACNELPMVYDNSKGFWDRWILLEYPYTFVSKSDYDKEINKDKLKIRDENIINKITTKEELSGFLNKSIEGLHRLLNNKEFSSTYGSDEIKVKWIRKSNSFMAFCLDCIEDEYDGEVTKKELRKMYGEYCKEHKLIAKSDVVIKKTLTEQYGASESRKEILNNFENIWTGIKLKKNTIVRVDRDFTLSKEGPAPLLESKKGSNPNSYDCSTFSKIYQYIKIHPGKELFVSDFTEIIENSEEALELSDVLLLLCRDGKIMEIKPNCWRLVE
jgi:putative DNA primase/helicase